MPEGIAEQFQDAAKRQEATRLGMWAFLGSETLLFAGLFALYASYRLLYPADFAEAIAHNDVVLGTANTLILLTSSFTVALSLHDVRSGRPRRAALLLFASIALGLAFLGLKMTEYSEHFRQGILPGSSYHFALLPGRGARLFFSLYYLTTGLHAVHVTAGLGVLAWLMVRVSRRVYTAEHHAPLELGALYWHLVDIVWIFLWPCLYLMQHEGHP